MSKRHGKRKNFSLLRKLNAALAEGAEVTIEWVTTIVVVAKRNWKVEKFNYFHDHLMLMFQKRSIQFHNDMEKILRNCWYYKTI